MPAPNVVVIGGGIIGLSVADALAGRGAGVVVLERRHCGAEASGAAAGMLAPLAEARMAGDFLQLALAGLEAHEPWLERLRAETGLDIGPHGPGMLRPADESQIEALRTVFHWQRSLGLPLSWLDAAQVRELEPGLSPCAGAVFSPRERHVQPPLIVRALERVLVTQGAVVRDGLSARGFRVSRGRVEAVRTDEGELACGEVVIAGGAWTREVAAELGAEVRVGPVRGQILALSPAPMPIRHTVYTQSGYLVPKPDGRLIVGATEDEAGFDARPTAAGVLRLLEMAARLSPGLAAAPFHSAWAGLRPAAPDRLPLLGPLPGWENVALATGHFRNGVLLAPLTGALVAPWVLDRRIDPLMAPFQPGRLDREGSGGPPDERAPVTAEAPGRH
jgi:glycine oxidase